MSKAERDRLAEALEDLSAASIALLDADEEHNTAPGWNKRLALAMAVARAEAVIVDTRMTNDKPTYCLAPALGYDGDVDICGKDLPCSVHGREVRIQARCNSCGKNLKLSADTLHGWRQCHDCKYCPECGSEFIMRQILPGTTEARCLSCLHHWRGKSTAIPAAAERR